VLYAIHWYPMSDSGKQSTLQIVTRGDSFDDIGSITYNTNLYSYRGIRVIWFPVFFCLVPLCESTGDACILL
jgi:hypothetical protein